MWSNYGSKWWGRVDCSTNFLPMHAMCWCVFLEGASFFSFSLWIDHLVLLVDLCQDTTLHFSFVWMLHGFPQMSLIAIKFYRQFAVVLLLGYQLVLYLYTQWNIMITVWNVYKHDCNYISVSTRHFVISVAQESCVAQLAHPGVSNGVKKIVISIRAIRKFKLIWVLDFLSLFQSGVEMKAKK